MKRDDPLLLPVCQICGKYKGVGPCKDVNCIDSYKSIRNDYVKMERRLDYRSCNHCENEAHILCSRCNSGFCETHGTGHDINQLERWNQLVGTCSICKQVVCENCWILEGDGAITCLEHHERGNRNHL